MTATCQSYSEQQPRVQQSLISLPAKLQPNDSHIIIKCIWHNWHDTQTVSDQTNNYCNHRHIEQTHRLTNDTSHKQCLDTHARCMSFLQKIHNNRQSNLAKAALNALHPVDSIRGVPKFRIRSRDPDHFCIVFVRIPNTLTSAIPEIRGVSKIQN